MSLDQIRHSISRSFPSKRAAVEQLSGWLHLSPAAIYNRLSGKTSFTIEEMQILADRLGQSWCIKSMEDHAPIIARYGVLNGLNRTPLEYLNDIVKYLEGIQRISGLSITYLANELPPFLLFSKRHLATLKFYHWGNSTWIDDQEWELYQFEALLQLEELHSKAMQISEFISQHTVCEFYQGRILSQITSELEYYRNFLKSDPKFKISKIKEELLEVVEELKMRCTSPGPDRQVFLINVKRITDTIVFESSKQSIAFISYDEPHYLEIQDAHFLHHFERMKINMQENATCISGMNRLERTKFFGELERKISAIQE